MEVIIGSIIGGCAVILAAIINIRANKKVKKLQNAGSSTQNSKNIIMIKIDDFYIELNKFMNKAEYEFIFIAGSMKRLISSYESIKKLSNEKNIKFKILALNIDKKEKGTIRLINFLHGKEERDYPHIEINYNNKWYKFYKKYILSLWDDAIPLQQLVSDY